MSRQFSSDFLVEVEKGNVAGHSIVHKFGRNDAVADGVWEDINTLGNSAWAIQAAVVVRVKAGGSANDTAAGTHARSILVEGLDETLALASETLTTNGTSASSATTTTFFRVFRATVATVGAYGNNNDTLVTIEGPDEGPDLIAIGVGDGQSQFGAYSIPLATTGYLLSTHLQVDSNKPADIRMCERDSLDDVSAPMPATRIIRYFDGIAGEFELTTRSPQTLAAKSDVWFEAEGSGASTEVSVDFEILLVAD